MPTSPPMPSRLPGQDADADGAIGFLIRKYIQKLCNRLPARIVAYDRDKNRAQVEILYRVTMANGANWQLEAPAEVPVVQIGGGGIVLNFPMKSGDLGWIEAADRDISLFLQSYEAEPGPTPRMHTFEHSTFYPDVMKGWIVDDPDAAVLQTLEGGTAIALKAGRVMINVEDTIFTITADGVSCNKPIVAPAFNTPGGLQLVTHTHPGDGDGKVGAPIN